jgi:hypothetical protein
LEESVYHSADLVCRLEDLAYHSEAFQSAAFRLVGSQSEAFQSAVYRLGTASHGQENKS